MPLTANFCRFKPQLQVHCPAVGGALRLVCLAAQGPPRTPKRTRRSPLHRSVRTLPEVGSTAHSALAALHSDAPHRSPSLRCAHCLREVPREAAPSKPRCANAPLRSACKMYEADGNMVINHITRFDLAGPVGTAASDLPMPQSLPGFRALRRNRVGDSLAPSAPIAEDRCGDFARQLAKNTEGGGDAHSRPLEQAKTTRRVHGCMTTTARARRSK